MLLCVGKDLVINTDNVVSMLYTKSCETLLIVSTKGDKIEFKNTPPEQWADAVSIIATRPNFLGGMNNGVGH